MVLIGELSDINTNSFMEDRLLFEHLMRDAFHCDRAEFSFANADFYDSGVGEHPEIKACIVCALISLAYQKNEGELRDKFLNAAKEVDNKNSFTDADASLILQDLHKKGLIY